MTSYLLLSLRFLARQEMCISCFHDQNILTPTRFFELNSEHFTLPLKLL
uniref:Uncharacterized protein n=1 Tax=Arundo donax TaxID=35708 RepID=A0A0A8ZTJ8_ARUDO